MTSLRFAPILCVLLWFPLAASATGSAPPASSGETGAPIPQAAAQVFPLAAFAAIGSSFAQSSRLDSLGWSEEQIEAFIEGVRGAFHGKAYPYDDAARQVSSEMGRRVQEIETREKQQAAAELTRPERLKQYIKEVRKHFNLHETDSGLCYSVQGGNVGARPGPDDTVVVSCIATAADGKTQLPQVSFEQARVKLADLLPGVAEGVQLMSPTSQAILVLPPDLSFGQKEWPQGIDRGTPLIFFVTLHEVISAQSQSK